MPRCGEMGVSVLDSRVNNIVLLCSKVFGSRLIMPRCGEIGVSVSVFACKQHCAALQRKNHDVGSA